MAAGNNGNVLQHFLELEAADALLSANGATGLRCLFTHGMAPFERFKTALPENDSKTRVMSRTLRMSERLRKGLDARESQPLLFQAFADLEVGEGHYPNSGVLMEWLTRRRSMGLRMSILETNASAQELLTERWPGAEEDARVKVVPGSWRTALKEEALRVRGPTTWPWLVTMDPYTFDPAATGPAKDAGSVSADDLKSLSPILASLFEGAPGAFAVFCYSMGEAMRRKFQKTIGEWNAALSGSPAVIFIGCQRDKTTTHVGAIVSKQAELLAELERKSKAFFGRADYAPALTPL